jgi:hypothetical protein
MSIYNYEYLNEFFFNKKKKKKEKPKEQYEILNADDIKLIKSELQSLVKKYNNDSNIKKRVLKILKEYIEKDKEYYDEDFYTIDKYYTKFHPYICKEFDKSNDFITFQVVDYYNDDDCTYGDLIIDITKELIKDLNNNLGSEFKCIIGFRSDYQYNSDFENYYISIWKPKRKTEEED